MLIYVTEVYYNMFYNETEECSSYNLFAEPQIKKFDTLLPMDDNCQDFDDVTQFQRYEIVDKHFNVSLKEISVRSTLFV